MRYIIEYFRCIWRDRYILVSLVRQDLLRKYNRSALGIAWQVITPLGMAVIVGAVYGILFGRSIQTYIPLIFASVNPWGFMSGSADASTGCYLSAEGYIKQSTVGTVIFPLRLTLVNFVNLMYSSLTFFAIYLFMEPDLFSWHMLMCIPGFLIMFLFVLGLVNVVSVINMYFRDFAPIQSLILQGLFYATPIIYDAKMLDERGVSFIYKINPFYYMIEVVRRPMLGGLPTWQCYTVSIALMLISIIIGIAVQMKYRSKIVFQM